MSAHAPVPCRKLPPTHVWRTPHVPPVPGPAWQKGGGNHGFYGIARLIPGATADDANRQMAAIVGRLTESVRARLAQYLIASTTNDYEAMIVALKAFGSIPADVDVSHLSRDPAVGQAYLADPLVEKGATARWYTEAMAAQEAAFADAASLDLPLDELGVYMDSMRVDCGPVRPPVRPLTGEQIEELTSRVRELGVLATPLGQMKRE